MDFAGSTSLFRTSADCLKEGCVFESTGVSNMVRCNQHDVVHVCRPDLFFGNTCIYQESGICQIGGTERVNPISIDQLPEKRPGMCKEIIKEMFTPFTFHEGVHNYVEDKKRELDCGVIDQELLESNIVRCYYLLHHHRRLLEQKRIRPEVLFNQMKVMFNMLCAAIIEDKVQDQAVKLRLLGQRVPPRKLDKTFVKDHSKLLTFDRVSVNERMKTPLYVEDAYITKRRRFLHI